ncbi:uncharacterized protein BXIN_1222 [Babesia sp. Xinjiang]|uniref:uncharacterized protein n=1 Tax=Babesia sp. Xinjiang TaxID=462227 RepID=UPI000A227437|nr:uncharacterized protein BXIN_1222 [Babesia sp. Xinjiang]ORM40187.1 hypothetical protein BXIN_1222 [Babesia sp. Xinjiang]
MSHMGPNGADGDPWQQLSGKASRLRVPKHAILTRDTPFGRHRPAPEVVEHMLDDLEDRMRNYFVLYNREREMRKEVEATAYRLEKELLAEREKVAETNSKIDHLEAKIKALIGQPLKIRETIDKIEILYNQMDTLVQAFVGIGSCATLQSQNRAAFLRLFLEYLYPCRDLDARLNTLYTAMYASLSCAGGAVQLTPLPEPVAPVSEETATPAPPLRGLSITVHQLMLKVTNATSEPGWYSCVFRYDHEPAESMETNASRVLKVNARPLDSASGVIDFNDCVEVHQLPPRIPNVIPKLILDVYAAKELVGSATVSIVDAKTLNPRDPWAIVNAQGNHCGDVIVTVRGIPAGAKLPAVGFARRNNELLLSSVAPAESEDTSKFVATVPDSKKETRPTDAADKKDPPQRAAKTPVVEKGPPRFIPPRATAPPKAAADEPFQPKQKAVFRKPLFLKSKGLSKPTPLGGEPKAPEATAEPPSAPAASKATPTEKAKVPSPPVEAKTAPVPPKVALSKDTVPKMAVKAPAKAPIEKQPAPTPKVTFKSPSGDASPAPKALVKTPAIAKADTATKAPPVLSKAVAKGTPAPSPAAVPKVTPKGAPAVAPKAAGVSEAKAPGVLPKVAPKATPAATTTDAAAVVPKVSLIAPKTKALSLTPKVAMEKIAPKMAPPAAASTASETSQEKKPLVPVVVKPKLLLKKPLAPKKASGNAL